jgi:hypothetical protein
MNSIGQNATVGNLFADTLATSDDKFTLSSQSDILRINSQTNNFNVFQLDPVVSIAGLGTAYDTAQLRIVNQSVASAGALQLHATSAKVGMFYRNTPDDRLYVANTSVSGTTVVYLGPNAIAWTGVSDRRLKNTIVPLPPTLDKILKLNPVSFKWNDTDNDNTDYGLIAQEVLEILPEVVDVPKDSEKSMMGITYTTLIPFLIKSIQEQQVLIKQLTDRLAILELTRA